MGSNLGFIVQRLLILLKEHGPDTANAQWRKVTHWYHFAGEKFDVVIFLLSTSLGALTAIFVPP
jgi:hypothetical protein